ncbi:hypothetical protein V6615_08515 [Oscillospiraceae bacterium PP1C4]
MRRLDQLVIEQSDITLQEIKEEMELQISVPAISNIIRNKLHYRYKKRRYMPVNETVQMYKKNEKSGNKSSQR